MDAHPQSLQRFRPCPAAQTGDNRGAGRHGEGPAHRVLQVHPVQAPADHLLSGWGQRGTVPTGNVS